MTYPMSFWLKFVAAFAALGAVAIALTFQHPPIDSVQRGYRGVGMMQLTTPAHLEAQAVANQLPEEVPTDDPAGQPASAVYENVQVLKNVDATEFLRDMTAITNWVAPQQGCGYCHNLNNLASDELYTKVVARRMLQMVQHINADWKPHVGSTGVTCYTCHRGQPVPANIWFLNPGPETALGSVGNRAGQNAPTLSPGMASLPYDPFTPFLDHDANIRVVSTTALPDQDHQSIKQTEWTYSLMVHMSTALGVNCTYCHNSRAFSDWSQSTPQRATAWYGIRMVRDVNNAYLEHLKGVFPPVRLGPEGDVPKVNCTTCHQGVNKPLLGASMVSTYPELTMATDIVAAAAPAPAAPEPAPAAPATPPAAMPAPDASPATPAVPAAPAPAPAP